MSKNQKTVRKVNKIFKDIPPHVERYNSIRVEISNRIEILMNRKEMSKHDLACKLNKPIDYVNGVLGCWEELSIKDIMKFEEVLEDRIIESL